MSLAPLKLCIYILTWNVATQNPRYIFESHYSDGIVQTDCPKGRPDLYVIGLQEVNPNPFVRLLDIFRGNQWNNLAADFLQSRNYKLLKTKNMNGLYLMIYAHQDVRKSIKKVQTAFTLTGGFWRSRGAASIRMDIHNKSMTFINSHLTPGEHRLDERINNYHRISAKHIYRNKKHIFDHDAVFWFGDLNFRLYGDEYISSPMQIKMECMVKRYKKLLEKDQLIDVRQRGRAFHLMSEELPNFSPTYKYRMDTTEPDLSLERRAAWSDRILYYANPLRGIEIDTLFYLSRPTMILSDHIPVIGLYLVRIDRQ